jgi:hypothetical protein
LLLWQLQAYHLISLEAIRLEAYSKNQSIEIGKEINAF